MSTNTTEHEEINKNLTDGAGTTPPPTAPDAVKEPTPAPEEHPGFIARAMGNKDVLAAGAVIGGVTGLIVGKCLFGGKSEAAVVI